MDSWVVELGADLPQSYVHNRIENLIREAVREYGSDPILGTVELYPYKYLVDIAVPVEFLTHRLSAEANANLVAEAQRFAEDIALKLGSDPKLQFRKINLLDIILYDLTMHFMRILSVHSLFESWRFKPGLLVLFTGKGTESFDGIYGQGLNVKKHYRIGTRNCSTRLLSLFRTITHGKPLTKLPSRSEVGKNGEKLGAVTKSRQDGEKKRVLFVSTDSGRGVAAEPLALMLSQIKQQSEFESFTAMDNEFSSTSGKGACSLSGMTAPGIRRLGRIG
jgi:hypothetical protein